MTMNRRQASAQILHVEDDDDDAELTSLGLQGSCVPINLSRVKDGLECMSFLRREGSFATAPTPDLILLDLNLPRMDGREVLDTIFKDDALRQLPVVIFTTSSAQADITYSYSHRCSSYVVKPVGFEEFEGALRHVTEYWFAVAALPRR